MLFVRSKVNRGNKVGPVSHPPVRDCGVKSRNGCGLTRASKRHGKQFGPNVELEGCSSISDRLWKSEGCAVQTLYM